MTSTSSLLQRDSSAGRVTQPVRDPTRTVLAQCSHSFFLLRKVSLLNLDLFVHELIHIPAVQHGGGGGVGFDTMSVSVSNEPVINCETQTAPLVRHDKPTVTDGTACECGASASRRPTAARHAAEGKADQRT